MSGKRNNSKPLIGALILSGALGALWLWQSQGTKVAAKPAETVPVSTAKVERQTIPAILEGVGTIHAFRSVNVHSQVDGQLQTIAFDEGQQLHKGELLARVDPRSYQAALDQAAAKKTQDEALLANARRDVERYADLVAHQNVSAQVYDTAKTKAAQLEGVIKADSAALDSARIQLEYTQIRSPIDGRAGIRQIDEGNILHGSSADASQTSGSSSSSSSSSDTLVVITQTHPISVIFTLPQDDLPRIADAMAKGELNVAVLGRNGGEPLDQGHLEVIDNQVDSASGTARLKATLPNERDHLWPGQFVKARLQVEERKDALCIPSDAVQHTAQGDGVYVVKTDDSVELRPVSVGVNDPRISEILSGLEEGETVVTAGHYRLKPGVKVAATPASLQTAAREGATGKAD